MAHHAAALHFLFAKLHAAYLRQKAASFVGNSLKNLVDIFQRLGDGNLINFLPGKPRAIITAQATPGSENDVIGSGNLFAG